MWLTCRLLTVQIGINRSLAVIGVPFGFWVMDYLYVNRG